MGMKGLSLESLKKHPSLLPLFFFVGLGMVGATVYSLRVAIKNPETSFNRKGNPEPWNDYSNKVYKLYAPNVTPETLKKPAPDY